ncbi:MULTISPECIES: MutS family DNA mismatch repair protein [Desulfitobacterium]|uniref:MutS family DNA mismatch repair protein n=1 Tax=Desulfitobacterium TaxID=36853 RepID=UPI002B21C448|nr:MULTISPECIES: DNA mismatch repair protein [Desulfitobacterium]MEA4903069.1 DNA mismatch repair protein [Desulfitobacterium sp.]MEA5025886.1 DNA mismatch repair protein [Desulfitobacterium hafniense]
MREPQKIYERRKQAFEKLHAKQQQTANRLSNYRLMTSILGLALAFFFYQTFNHYLGIAIGLSAVALFSYLAIQHKHVRTQLRYSEILIGLNRQGEDRLLGDWVKFPDLGSEFKDENHPYASDLDLFGQGSIFQWINSAQTPQGRETLANILKEPLKNTSEITHRQTAITELGQKLSWRQRFESEGILISGQLNPTDSLIRWAEETDEAYLQPMVKLGMRVFPAVTLIMIVLYAFHLVPWQIPILLAAAQFLLLKVYGAERSQALSTVYRFEASLKTYTEMLKHFENQNFNSEWLKIRQKKLCDQAEQPAYQQIKRLSKIADWISSRENAIFIIVNILTLWDYQCMIALEEWKKKSGKLLKNWLEVLAEVEALSSLSNIRFDNPDWAIPVIHGSADALSSLKMGHPLLTRKRVTNDFAMKSPSGVILITGSNMSGKSTFLRTIGSNLVLAYAGAPVCAEEFSCSMMNIWTCMRVSDNLEQSISSFYAEILRIKQIVEAAKTDKPVFFLLDEIFKGTNSHDRHYGAKALINQLQKDGALGLISTHDLELGDLEKESQGRVKNYNFREYYENQEIHFDYKLRPGISTTRNALYLIKLAGIELDEI